MPRKKKEDVTQEQNDDAVSVVNVEDFEIENNEYKEEIDMSKVDNTPTSIDPNWTEYVLSQLDPDEIRDGNPKVDGLRRLVEKLVGPIVSAEIKCEHVPVYGGENSMKENTATILAKVVVVKEGKPLVTTSVADASSASCPPPYDKYLSSIAETRAKARCYREILRLKNVVSADEMPDGAASVTGPELITDNQINLIETNCKDLNLDIKEVFTKVIKERPSIRRYTREDAVNVLDKLREAKKSNKPKSSTADYDPTWREYFA